MVREGHWDALYPTPVVGATQNAGYPEASIMKPYYAKRAMELGIGDTFRFALPPPAALMLVPLSWLPFTTARILWLVLMSACIWGTAVFAGRIYSVLRPHAAGSEGIVCLGTILLPRALLSTRLGNVSPFMAFCLAAGIWAIINPQRKLGSNSCVTLMTLGAVAKYTPGAVVPVMLLRGHIRHLVIAVITLVILILLTVLAGGRLAFVEYRHSIAPTQLLPTMNWTNQTIWGALSEITSLPVRERLLLVAQIVRWGTILAIATLLVLRREYLKKPAISIAAVLALISWIHIFGPLTWGHYSVLFAPFVGWIWSLTQNWLAKLLIIILLGVMFIPWAQVPIPIAGVYLMKYSLLVGMFVFLIVSMGVIWVAGMRRRSSVDITEPPLP